MIDNAVSVIHHIIKIHFCFYMKIHKFEQKGVLGLGFLEKDQSEANKF